MDPTIWGQLPRELADHVIDYCSWNEWRDKINQVNKQYHDVYESDSLDILVFRGRMSLPYPYPSGFNWRVKGHMKGSSRIYKLSPQNKTCRALQLNVPKNY